MTFREFTGKNVEEAIRSAMAEFSSDLGDLDIEILSQGSRGLLGVGGEEARILAAPKSAVAGAATVRAETPRAETPRAEPRRPEPPAAPPTEEPVVEEAGPADQVEQSAWPATDTASADGAASDPSVAGDVSDAADAPFAQDDAPDVVIGLDPDDQVAELARADEGRRERGGRGRGGRARGGRERDHAPREPRGDRPPRDRTMREPTPFVSGAIDALSDEERATLETAKTVLAEMLELMGLAATVEVAGGGETARLNVNGDDLGALIGRRGEKLASLQHIVNLIVGRREGHHHRIAIDVENYRGRREEQLRDVADRAAKRVIQSGKIIQLEAMPAIERRVVHMALLENGRVRTQSVGVEPNRRIVVLPATQVSE